MKSLYESAGNIIRRIYDRRIDGPPVLDTAVAFPSAQRFFGAWQSIRDEAVVVAQQMHRVPRFHEIVREQTAISANDQRDWRMLILKAYGAEFPRNMAACPNLAASVAAAPEVLSASISIPCTTQTHPRASRAVSRRVALLSRGLSMPRAADGRPAAVLNIDGTEHRLADGEFLLWDDTFPHEVINDSDEVRTVLLLDVWRRGMPLDMRLLSRLLIFTVRVMARMRGVG